MDFIYCRRCLSRGNDISLTKFIHIDDVYKCNCCNESLPAMLIERIAYDTYNQKLKRIVDETKVYVEECIFDSCSNKNELLTLRHELDELHQKMKVLFERFLNHEITEKDYKKEAEILRSQIVPKEKDYMAINYENVDVDLIKNVITSFIDNYNYKITKALQLKTNISFILYDYRNGRTDTIFKIEEKMKLPSASILTLAGHEEASKKEYYLPDLVYEIIKEQPHLKRNDILNILHEKYSKEFCLRGLKRAIQKLEWDGLICLSGNSSMKDGYILTENKRELSKYLEETLEYINTHPNLTVRTLQEQLKLNSYSAAKHRVYTLIELGYLDKSFVRKRDMANPYMIKAMIYTIIEEPAIKSDVAAAMFNMDRRQFRNFMSHRGYRRDRKLELWVKV